MFRAMVFTGMCAAGLAAGGIAATGPAHGIFEFTKVTLDLTEARRGSTTPVTVNVTVRRKAIDFRRAVVWVRCTEEVDIKGHKIPERKDSDGKIIEKGQVIDLTERHELLPEKDFTVANAGTLPKQSSHALKGEIAIPAHLPASFKGKYARIKWEAKAGLDMGVGSPDSGWQEITVE